MRINTFLFLALAGGAIISLTGAMRAGSISVDETSSIASTLDAFHTAASKADFNGYFSFFAPEGVFLGTDASERWTVEEFKAYAKPSFDKGQGWTYSAIDGKRFITIAADGRTAWFDELLRNEKYGTCRGSGVLRRVGDDWLIAQYNLAFMIPNDTAKDVVALIKAKQQ